MLLSNLLGEVCLRLINKICLYSMNSLLQAPELFVMYQPLAHILG